MYFVYILQSLKDRSYYTGSTEDVEKRLAEHNSCISKYSSTKCPFKLVWYCAFNDKSRALAFEKYLKQGSGFAFARKHLVQIARAQIHATLSCGEVRCQIS